ncbi:MAG TPA: glycosyltransferase family 4 protein [Candidatus Obscuribacterales bacterium]
MQTREFRAGDSTRQEKQSLSHEGGPAGSTRVKLAMVSCGLGNVNRGFEVSTARWFHALSKQTELDVRLFAGGKYPNSTMIMNIPRDFMLNWVLRAFTPFSKRRVWEFAYGTEMVTSAVGILPELIAWNPDVVWTKDAPFGCVLKFFRDILGLKFKLALANGGGFRPRTYKDFDFIQHLQPSSFQMAIAEGIPEAKMQILPHFAHYFRPQGSRSEVRREFGLADDDFVVVCVSAWNCYHKRIDYLINEVAQIDDPKVKLLLCGHPEPDTPQLKELGRRILRDRIQWFTLPPQGVHKALFASDVYVIASVNEVFGAATIEAALAELPIVCHPNEGTRYILGEHCGSLDLTREGVLAKKLSELRDSYPDATYLRQVRDLVAARFSEEVLAQKFASAIISLRQTS